MTAAERGRGPLLRASGWLLLTLLAGYAFAMHHGLGPAVKVPPQGWWTPDGFLREWLLTSPLSDLVGKPWRAVPTLCAPALLLAIGVWALTRSALARMLAVFLVLASGSFVLYGLQGTAARVWGFFHFRWSAVMTLTALCAAVALTAPLLAHRWLQRGVLLRILLYLPPAAAAVVLLRNATGTDPMLPFAISPWPVIPVFGLELVGSVVLALLAVLGLVLAALDSAHRGMALAALVMGLAVLEGVRRAFGLHLEFVAASCTLGLLATVLSGRSTRLARAAFVTGLGVLLVGLPIAVGQTWARIDYQLTRDDEAQQVIDALAAWYEREQEYPDRLRELVEAGDLEQVPSPQIGFPLGEPQSFTYQNFGTSYLLEFSAPGWVQCVYNPPWADEDGDGNGSFYDDEGFYGEDDGAGDADADADEAPEETEPEELDGAWSCPSRPPDLW